MKFIKKSFLVFIVSSLMTCVFADEISDIKNAFIASSGFFYNKLETSLVYVSFDGVNYSKQDCFIDFENKTIKKSQSWSRGTYNDARLEKEKMYFELETGKLKAFHPYGKEYYIPLFTDDYAKVINFMKEKVNAKFEFVCGEYTDKHTGRVYTLSKGKDGFNLNVKYNEPGIKKTVNVPLKIEGTSSLSGNDYYISYYSGMLRIFDPLKTKIERKLDRHEADCRCGGEEEESLNYLAAFNVLDPDFEIAARRETELGGKYPYYDGSIKYLLCTQGYAAIQKEITKNYSHSFNTLKAWFDYHLYKDNDGWKKLVCGNEKFMFIDGEVGRLCFNYHKDSFKNDIESQKTALFERNKENLADEIFYNLKASSTLKDKYHTYSVDGIIQIYYTGRWAKNNIPWVEGKDGDGIGEYIEFDIVPVNASELSKINFHLINGYVDPVNPHFFKENNRIKTLLVETDVGEKKEINFNDEVEITNFELLPETKHVKMTIKEVYKGIKYSDTCLTSMTAEFVTWRSEK